MEETYEYTCHYCKKKYVPKRRRINKFCSNSCRSGNWHLLNPKEMVVNVEREEFRLPVETKPQKKEKLEKKINKMRKELKTNKPSTLIDFLTSTAGAFVGSKLERASLNEENKPLTKGDMMSLLSNMQRFQKVNNLPPNGFGQLPFIDVTTGNIEYIGKKKSFLDN